MASPSPRFPHDSTRRPGMTLLELTVVLMVLLALISIFFVGVHAWKNGANRTTCILHIRTVQMAVRGYANSHELEAGQSVPGTLKDEIIGTGKRIESEPECPGGGGYSYSGNAIPPIGTLFMSCSLSTDLEHEPENHVSW